MSPPLDPRDQITVLLKEYDTLRSEVLLRTTSGFHLVYVGAVLVTAMVGWVAVKGLDYPWPYFYGVVIAILGASMGFASYLNYRDLHKNVGGIKRIEARVKELSGANDLLVWETFFGGYATGKWSEPRKFPD